MLVTARSKSYKDFQDSQIDILNANALSYAEAIKDKKQAIGFCENCANRSNLVYDVTGLDKFAARKTKDKNKIVCKDCGYALFWSRSYSEPMTWYQVEINRHSRRLAGFKYERKKRGKQKMGFDFQIQGELPTDIQLQRAKETNGTKGQRSFGHIHGLRKVKRLWLARNNLLLNMITSLPLMQK